MSPRPPSRQLTIKELELHLKEQTIFLLNSCESYDADWMDGDVKNSHECEFKRIATTLRVLLYDYGKSKSLFKHLQLKDTLFYNTSAKIDDSNIAGGGLTVLSVGGRVPNFWFPKRTSIGPDKLDFEKWWSGCILKHSSGKTYSRLDLVKLAANVDGGAHVSSTVESAYDDFKSGAEGKIILTSGTTLENAEQHVLNFIHQSIRQIAHEVLLTIQTLKPSIFEEIGLEVIDWPATNKPLSGHAPKPFRIHPKSSQSRYLRRRMHIVYSLAELTRSDELLKRMNNVVNPEVLEEHEIREFEKELNIWISDLREDDRWPPK